MLLISPDIVSPQSGLLAIAALFLPLNYRRQDAGLAVRQVLRPCGIFSVKLEIPDKTIELEVFFHC